MASCPPLRLILSLLASASTLTAEPTRDIVIDVARKGAVPNIGFGWSSPERGSGRAFRWMNRTEADIWFHLEEPRDVKLMVTAAPKYISWKRQNVGLYLNDHFITEWLCPDDAGYQVYHAEIRRGRLKPGRNRLTLRVGYRHRTPPDTRKLGLAVERIQIRIVE